MTLQPAEMAGIVERLLTDFEGRASLETVGAALRECADRNPDEERPDVIEELIRLRLHQAV